MIADGWVRLPSRAVERTPVRRPQSDRCVGREARELASSQRTAAHSDARRGSAWGEQGVLVSQMGICTPRLYYGELFDNNAAVARASDDADDLAAIWAFCFDRVWRARSVDQIDSS